jgi:hypothetical protein
VVVQIAGDAVRMSYVREAIGELLISSAPNAANT